MHLRIVVTYVSENIYDFSYGISVTNAPLYNTNNGLLSILSTVKIIYRDENVVSQNLVINTQESIVTCDLQYSDKSILSAFENLYYFSLRFMSGRQHKGKRALGHC